MSSRFGKRAFTVREKVLLVVVTVVVAVAAVRHFFPAGNSRGIPNYLSREIVIVAGDPNNWGREIQQGYDPPFKQVVLLQISCTDGHLRGDAVFFNSHESPIALEGMQMSSDEPYLTFTAQVSNDIDGMWRTIGESRGAGQLVSIVVPKESSRSLPMNFEIFRPFTNKYRFGRTRLRTGDSPMFELKDLLPPVGTTASN